MKIELLHSITHDGQEYLPGLHELPDDLAAVFLRYTWAAQPYLPPTATAGQVRQAGEAAVTAPVPSGTGPEAGKGKKR